MIFIRTAAPADAAAIAGMVKALTDEIITRTGEPHFHVDIPQTTARCRGYLESGRYTVLLACDEVPDNAVGFAAFCESHALYAEGAFGIVQEFYVAPEARSTGVGRQLVDAAAEHARRREWKRLELCTPPLPEFDRTLAFYERNGFVVTGGRKMKRVF
jgi:GNAT superfamily N-acetyltransferase